MLKKLSCIAVAVILVLSLMPMRTQAAAAPRFTVETRQSLPGDVDGDLAVTDWDAIQLNRYLAGWQLPIHDKAADLDADGTVTDWDAILLERTLAGWKPESK